MTASRTQSHGRSRRRHHPRALPPLVERYPLLPFAILVAFFALCVLGGGASRPDVLSLLYLRPAAVAALAAFLLLKPVRPGELKPLFALFAALVLIIAIQLVPLPPDLFLGLPGRARFGEAAAALGQAQPWRPLSLTPDLTINSLIACLPPLAALIGFTALRDEQRASLLPVLIGASVLCSLLGAAQIAGGAHSGAYLYAITHSGVAVGFFANRNHEAALLAATYPMLRVWTMMPSRSPEYRRARGFIAVGIGLFLIPMVLITGSRAGMALTLLGIAAAYFIAPWSRLGQFWNTAKGRLIWAGMWVLPFVVAALVAILGRAWSFQRVGLLVDDSETELRIRNFPLMLDIVRDYMPFGTGFGSFDPIFRMYEPDQWLSVEYFNHAHNELVEMALTGGIPALLLIAAFLIWFARAALRTIRPYRHPSPKTLLGRLGAVMILQFLLASIVDYPLRTPLLGVIFVFAAGWLAAGSVRRRGSEDAEHPGPATLP